MNFKLFDIIYNVSEAKIKGGVIMSKVAVVLAPGFEEIEALAPVDVLRRADIQVDIIGFDKEVAGAHNIVVKADKVLDESLGDYDMIVLPGGLPGATNLRDNEIVIDALKKVAASGGYTTAICAAPIVLDRAGLLKDKKFTNYPGFEKEISSGSYQDALVVVDGKVVTGRGPGVALDFSYELLEILGGNRQEIVQSMQYDKLFELKEG